MPPANQIYQPTPPVNPMHQPTHSANQMYHPTPTVNPTYQPPPANLMHQPMPVANQMYKSTPPSNPTYQPTPPASLTATPLAIQRTSSASLTPTSTGTVSALPPPPFRTSPRLVPIEHVMREYPGGQTQQH